MLRIAMAESEMMLMEDIVKNELKERAMRHERKKVYPTGYRVNRAPLCRVPGRKDSVQHGIPVEHQPI